MRTRFLAIAGLAALAACNTASDDADTDGDAVEAEAEEAQAMLPNDAPAYPGIDLSAVADQGVDGERQTVTFETGASPDEVYDFYRTAYLSDDYEITSANVSVRGEENGEGGRVSVTKWSNGTRGTVSPRAEGGEFDLGKEYGDGFPAYSNAEPDTVEENVLSNDRRTVAFETSDSLADVLDFYRSALRGTYEVESLGLSVQSRTMRRRASISVNGRYNAAGSRVSVTNYDPARESGGGDQ